MSDDLAMRPPRDKARVAVLWATAGAATAAATTAAVVVGRAGLGQQQNRIADAVVVTACCGVGAIVLTSRPGHPVGRALLVGGAAMGLGSLGFELLVSPLRVSPWNQAAGVLLVSANVVRGVGWLTLAIVLPLVFPDGARGRRRWWLRLALADLGLYAIAVVLEPGVNEDRLPGLDNPIGLPQPLAPVADWLVLAVIALGIACLMTGLRAIAGRWRRGNPVERQQVGWFALGLGVTVVSVGLLLTGVLGGAAFTLAVAALPLAVGVAVLQHRLYEVDRWVNRALLYGLLTTAVAAVYVLVVAGIGATLGTRGAGWLPWVATAVVAVAFEPLRQAIQAGVNRVTYGAWREPEALIHSLNARLEHAAAPDRALPDVVATARGALRLDHLRVTTEDGRTLAADGVETGDVRRLPLVQAGAVVGELAACGRLRRRDEAVLTELAGALAPAVRATRLHEDLLRSRERLVQAREEERRRLRRDLHDGLGPALAGLSFKIDTARNRLGDDPLLREMRGDVQAAVADVRRVVEGLRPVSLDELGLVGSLRRLVDGTPPGGPAVHLVADDPLVADDGTAPAAAVEVAAYRIVQEALTNVLRHSGADTCEISVRGEKGRVVVRIEDDGCGPGRAGGNGIGLDSMRERAEELGGSLELDRRAGGGTVLRAVLPRSPA